MQSQADSFHASCEDSASNIKLLKSEPYTYLKIDCPKKCIESSSDIIGMNPYQESSSICKAAIHSGIINDDEGGSFVISFVDENEEFLGYFMNGIESIKRVYDKP